MTAAVAIVAVYMVGAIVVGLFDRWVMTSTHDVTSYSNAGLYVGAMLRVKAPEPHRPDGMKEGTNYRVVSIRPDGFRVREVRKWRDTLDIAIPWPLVLIVAIVSAVVAILKDQNA